MAKKLFVGNYRFDASEKEVYVSGNINAERFLLITNVTRNKIIYNFADINAGFAGLSYNSDTDETGLSLLYDTSTHLDTDILQIFVQGDYQEITPAEDILDPVGKMRVSNPENLIDTDFEYGLQSTKWETLQTVNNIPTIYSSSGDTPIDGITSVDAVAGSKNIKVNTNIPHGLGIGDPISVQGLSQYQAEGYFIVTNVPSTLQFYFELDVNSTITGDLSGSYTTIIPGKFFEGSTLPVSTADGATTDGNTPSTVSVTTSETHGFSTDTKVYLRNTVGPRTLRIIDSTATAPDGRPFVDTVASFANNNAIQLSTNTGRGTYKQTPVVTFDWESTYTKYLASADVNASNETITWNNHSLRNGYALLFQNPYYGKSDANLTDGAVYYCEVIDNDTIKLHTDTGLTGAVSLNALNNTYGNCRLSLVYKVEYASGTTRRTPMGVFNASQTGGVTTNYVSSSGTGSVTTNLTLPASITSTNVSLVRLEIAGDTNSTFETVTLTMAGVTDTVYGGAQNQVYVTAIKPNGQPSSFNGINLSSFLTGSSGAYQLSITHSCDPSVGQFVWGNDRYRVRLVVQQQTGNFTESEKSRSGGDLIDAIYGLGSVEPSNIIAFQGRTSGSYSSSNDAYSYLANQRTYGRYGTFAIRNPSYNMGGNAPIQSGDFNINYNDNTVSYGTSSEIFYVFCKNLTTDRNTVYIQNHGILTNQDVTVTVNTTDYSNGDRFAYVNTTADAVDMSASFTATASPVNTDVIRLQTAVSPNTDDIVKVPQRFSIAYNSANSKYNSIYVNNHKITGNIDAIYTNISGAVIGGLTDGQTYAFERLDDSRLRLANTGAQNTANILPVVTQNNNNVYTTFVDIETPSGFVPATAKITKLEFRGDFSSSGEYAQFEILNSSSQQIGSWIIGQFEGADSAVYRDSTTFTNGYDLTSVLFTDGGKVGFRVRVSPQPSVNYGPGGGPWWGFRLNVNTEDSGIVLTGPGSGGHSFDVNSVVGAYDGVLSIASIPTSKSFTLSGTFKIPIREYVFTSSEINNSADTITFAQDHNLLTGEKVTYDSNGNTSILPAGTTDTFVIVITSKIIKLATSSLDAESNVAINITGQTGSHKLTSNNIIKNIKGTGTITTVNGTKVVTGSGTKFLNNFKRFDKIYINNGSYVQVKTVDTVSTNVNMTLFENADTSISGTDYYYATQLALRPDGYSLHKSFDGGVDITAGTSPNSRIARQTRKYFRYQSGKGLQTSFAINFNPPKLVKNLIKATGTTATVDTQEQHNLSVGDSITIADAVVSSGTNTYNGTFTVATVPSPFQFTYTMATTPADVRAAGFPTYVRASWADSFVRAGMFDDQNGFFYEYDGQALYAVRRSSTSQIAGDINVTRGSQIVGGEGTSFTTQLSVGEFLVIRGQSYKITEISSDIRLIVQPAYRGVTATRVKATKTIDTRTSQQNWNIDKADGTGFTGYILNTKKIQMAYIDYSWYGAGKIRYGFKDRVGHIRYFHEYRHNNLLNESYFRSGNLPARYEIQNGPNSTASPTLFHFGTSIIMDGTFDDDKAYQFTGQSRPFAFTSGGNSTITSSGNSTFELITLDGQQVYVYAFPISASNAQTLTVGNALSNGSLPVNNYITQITVDGSNSKVFINYPATTQNPTGGSEYGVISSGASLVIGESTEVPLQRPIPLISVRLAPSVDSSLTGALGEREIVNRMQLRLRQAAVTTNKDIEVFLIQNSLPSDIVFQNAQSPSLSQIIKHSSGDTLLAGTTIFSSKVSTGSAAISLADLLEIGNSILGGDGIFPAGPDILTVAVQAQDPAGITFAAPFTVSANISWSESQA